MLTVEGFIAWVKQQPRDKKFNYHSHTDCPCGAYAISLGYEGGFYSLEVQDLFTNNGNYNGVGVYIAKTYYKGSTYGELADALEEFARAPQQ